MATKSAKSSPQDVLEGFRALQRDQHNVAAKIGELQGDIREHQLVIETLEKVDGGRRCYRQMGGTLVARTVDELLPSLRDKLAKMQEAMINYKQKLSEAGEKLNEYRTKNNIRFVNENEALPSSESTTSGDAKTKPTSAVINS